MLAFIRRVRGDSVLFVKDLDTGRERPVYRDLDRDLQEAWAVHGVYPHMAWTPDSESLVLWAGGKIRRVSAASGEAETIPFHVEQDYKVYEALRHQVDVAPETFRTKMLRWVKVSPDGERVVFQALGRLWVRDLPDGEPERLTRQDEHFEFYPAWSRDSQHIVYTTWDDQDYGTVRVVRASGGSGRTVSPEPGHYVEPDFSPDGETVVYRKLSGNQLRGTDYGMEPGVYRVSVSGGGAKRIHDSGRQPQFGPEGERIYLLMADERDKRRFISVNRDGHDEREHLKAEFATEFELSPDGEWVAFTERFHAYIAPFVATGGSRDIGPEDKAMPVKRVTRDAGDWLHWSGDGERLHWDLGPELYTMSVEEAFAFLNGDRDAEPAEPVSEGTDLGFDREYAAPGNTVAYTGGRVVTMDQDLGVIDNGTVVVEGNRITAVGAEDVVEVPGGAEVVDISGKTLIPGLIDVHWHGAQGSAELTPEQNWYNYATLALGVTTIHDPSNDTSEIFAASELGKAGMITAPRIFSTGTILYGATTSFTAEIDEYEDAKRHLRRMKAAGAFSVKSYNQPRRNQRQQVVAAGRELDMMVVPEGGSLYTHDITMVMDGHTGVEHNIPQGAVYDDVKQLWGASEVGYTPTLVVAYGGLSGEYYWYAKQAVWEHPILKHFVPRTVLDSRSRRRETAPENEWGHMQAAQVAAELQDAGVPVQMGAHGQREGLGAHWEMWMFEQGGMTNTEVLRTATIDAARYLGLDGDIGSIEAGKLADLVVVDGNPLEDIRVTDDVHRVMVNGELYDPKTMNRVFVDEERQPFWFEDCPYQPGPDLACE
jgi:imidazolonepropionase-like amidohydrolase